eukprot:1160543-Pelagomonas_calceolata.AAC.7
MLTCTATLVGSNNRATAMDHSNSSRGGSGTAAMPVFCFALQRTVQPCSNAKVSEASGMQTCRAQGCCHACVLFYPAADCNSTAELDFSSSDICL